MIFALDELGDPPAGLYSMLKGAGAFATLGNFAFRDKAHGPPNAALEARWIAADGRSRNEIVHEVASEVRADGIEVARDRTHLTIGSTPYLTWMQPVHLGFIRIRSYFFKLPGGVARLDVGTLQTSARDVQREVRRILNSVRATRG